MHDRRTNVPLTFTQSSSLISEHINSDTGKKEPGHICKVCKWVSIHFSPCSWCLKFEFARAAGLSKKHWFLTGSMSTLWTHIGWYIIMILNLFMTYVFLSGTWTTSRYMKTVAKNLESRCTIVFISRPVVINHYKCNIYHISWCCNILTVS